MVHKSCNRNITGKATLILVCVLTIGFFSISYLNYWKQQEMLRVLSSFNENVSKVCKFVLYKPPTTAKPKIVANDDQYFSSDYDEEAEYVDADEDDFLTVDNDSKLKTVEEEEEDDLCDHVYENNNGTVMRCSTKKEEDSTKCEMHKEEQLGSESA